ncbi:MAG: DUF1223 domain-containing protein [Gemmataceae bacterium]
MRGAISLFVVLALGGLAQAGGEPLAGNWKLTFHNGDEQATLWLLHLEAKEGKVAGKATSLGGVPPTKLGEIKVTGDLFAFNLELPKAPPGGINFEGRLPRPGAKKVFGTIKLGGKIMPATLETTAATDAYELNKEVVLRTPTDPRVFQAVVDLIGEAKAKKATAAEVKEWIDTVLKTGQLYGPRLLENLSGTLIPALEKDYPAQAVAIARKAEESLDPKAPADVRLRYLTMLASALRKAGEADEAKAIEAKVEKMEVEAYAEYAKAELSGIKIEKSKEKAKRGVLVELFTGAQCPPCVAADLAFDALERTYAPSDVVLLQYHLHIPGPDALTNPDSIKRQKYYDDLVEGTPTMLLNGKTGPVVGGLKQHAEDRYQELRKDIGPLLEKAAGADVSVSAERKGDKIDIKATVKGLKAPSEKIKLRIVVVEDHVRYQGRNGMLYHSRVVRDMPGGAAGFPLVKEESEHTASVDLGDLRKRLDKYLDKFEKEEDPFPDSQRPMRLKSLSIVAFVQNDATREVLQATDVKVKGE